MPRRWPSLSAMLPVWTKNSRRKWHPPLAAVWGACGRFATDYGSGLGGADGRDGRIGRSDIAFADRSDFLYRSIVTRPDVGIDCIDE